MSNVTRYEPFEDFFKGFFVRPLGFPAEPNFDIKIDVKEGEKEFLVEAEIPA